MPRWELVSCSWRLLRRAGRAAALAEVEPSIELALGAKRRAEDMTRSVWLQLMSGEMAVDELWMVWTGVEKAFRAVVGGRKKLTQLRKEIAFRELSPRWISVVFIGSTKIFKYSNLISYSLVCPTSWFPAHDTLADHDFSMSCPQHPSSALICDSQTKSAAMERIRPVIPNIGTTTRTSAVDWATQLLLVRS